MKKILLISALALLMLGLVACNNIEEEDEFADDELDEEIDEEVPDVQQMQMDSAFWSSPVHPVALMTF